MTPPPVFPEDDDAYRTVIFCGTTLESAEPEFLATQMAAIRTGIETGHPDSGFPDA